MKNKLCRRCCVPLRVPMCTLTNKTENWKVKTENQLVLTFHFSLFTLLQGLWTPRCRLRSHILVSPKGELNLLRMSNLIRLKVGFADNRAHPDGIASASQVTRMLLLLSQAFRYIPGYSMSKFYFVNRRESNPHHPGKSIKSGLYLSVRLPGLHSRR